MADKLYYADEGSSVVRAWALARVLEGAGWGLVISLSFAALYFLIWVVSLLLPEQSKQAPPPNVTGALIQPLTMATA